MVKILGQLSEIEIKDDLNNKPIRSLFFIFRAWAPQTTADHEMRVQAINMLLKQYPGVGWTICLQQLDEYKSMINNNGVFFQIDNYKPKWRSDGYGYGEPFKARKPILSFIEEIVKIVLNRPSYTVEMLCNLIAYLSIFKQEDQDRVWDIVSAWYDADRPDEDIEQIRKKIRVTFLTGWPYEKANEKEIGLIKKASVVYIY